MRNKAVVFSVIFVAFMFVASQAMVLAEDTKESTDISSAASSTDSLMSTSTTTDMTNPPADVTAPAGTSEITTLKEKTTETETTTTKTPKKKHRVKKHRQYVK
ncbi:MAG: hypothetical protein HZC17_01510 [Candidatus Omnitrophica bacterium]|nr:hypothetical protein [Candidatus Omnitrophota bacterium]